MKALSRTLTMYPSLLRVAFAEAVAYRAEFLIWMLTTTMPLVMMALWTTVAAEAPVGRFDEPEMVTYFLVVFLTRILTGTWVVWLLVDEIRRGALSQRLLRPVHPLVAYSAENLAGFPIRVAVALPMAVILLATTGGERLSGSALDYVAFAWALLGAWLINFLSMIAIGCLAFFIESALGLFGLWLAVSGLLSGYMLPLEIYPDVLRDVSDYLPFRFMISLPVEILMGRLPGAALGIALLVQLGWIAVFGGLCVVMWKKGLARYAAFGG